MNRKRNRVVLIDTLTILLLIIQVQSTIVFVSEMFEYLSNFSWDTYFYLYSTSGIADTILDSPYEQIYNWIVFIVFCLNIYVIVVKLVDFYKKELLYAWNKAFIIINIFFIFAKVIEFNNFLIAIMGI